MKKLVIDLIISIIGVIDCIFWLQQDSVVLKGAWEVLLIIWMILFTIKVYRLIDEWWWWHR